MYRMLCVLVATIAYGTATGQCQGSQAGMTAVTFQSSTYSDMRQLLAREATTGAVTVRAYLALLIDGEAKPFDPAAFDACVAAAPGYSMGFDAAVRAQSITDAVRFLQRSL